MLVQFSIDDEEVARLDALFQRLNMQITVEELCERLLRQWVELNERTKG